MNHLKQLIETGLSLEAKATPGPWVNSCHEVISGSHVEYFINSKNASGECVAYIDENPEHENIEETKSNVQLISWQRNNLRNILTALQIATEALESLERVSGRTMIKLVGGHNEYCLKQGCYGHYKDFIPSDFAKIKLIEIKALFPEDKREDETPTKGVRE